MEAAEASNKGEIFLRKNKLRKYLNNNQRVVIL